MCAMYAHFGPGKFPDNWNTVFYCVTGYIVINAILAIFCHFKEMESFLVTLPKQEVHDPHHTPEQHACHILFQSC